MQHLNPELFDFEVSLLVNHQQFMCAPVIYK